MADSATVTGSILGPFVSVGNDAVVTDSLIRDSIIGEGSRVAGCFLEQSLVGSNALVEAGAQRLNLGDSSELKIS